LKDFGAKMNIPGTLQMHWGWGGADQWSAGRNSMIRAIIALQVSYPFYPPVFSAEEGV
jgi:hypothetical protein